ncbi:MAG: type VI secretion system secreted protein VgrG [Cellvibrionaceae bacterium]|jgi:type VI secretion system secreted protein VgrG
MGQLTQDHRSISITDFSLGKDTFLLTAIDGSEYISDIFDFQIEVLSEDLDISPEKIIGKTATVTLKSEKADRKINGYINAFAFGEIQHNNLRQYKMTMVPWLWFLSKTNDHRIFQEKTTKAIVTQVFNDLGFSDFVFKAAGGSSREYCVQHNESDLNFISRLLEEDGIAYYFVHEEGKHVLFLVDQKNAYEECLETDLEYSKGNQPNTQISSWEHFYEFKKGQWTLNDYNFKEPLKDLKANANTISKFANNNKFEHYEYPGLYDSGLGDTLVKVRLEAEEARRDMVKGMSDCASFYAGGKFTLAKHTTTNEKGNYIIIGIHHSASDASYFSGEEGQATYSNNFVCIPADVHFRPNPIHKKPVMRGPQSALVVGPKGEEIYIDEHGRIKVQFIWDREGKTDENSSCFVRVVQSWAGNQWGTSFIPRMGQEVIVNFLDGDPDRPLVTGAVYNGKNKPTYPSKTQSGIKTRSTKGGTPQNYNELRFEDKKGSEQIYVHAEKDLDTQVENNETLTVDNDRTKIVKHDENSTIENDRNKTVNNNQTESIKQNKTIDVGNDHREAITGNMTIHVDKDLKESVTGQYLEDVTKHYGLHAKTITMDADDKIIIKTGAAQIVMESNGDITISGKTINIKGSSNVVIKGSKVITN